MIVNSVISGNTPVKNNDFIVSAEPVTDGSYIPVDGSKITNGDDIYNVLQGDKLQLFFNTYWNTGASANSGTGAYGIGNYIDDSLLIYTFGYSGGPTYCHSWTRSGNTFTSITQSQVTISNDGLQPFVNYAPKPLPFKFKGYVVFPALYIYEEVGTYIDRYRVSLYYTTDGSSWSVKHIANVYVDENVSSVGAAFDIAHDDNYIYLVMHTANGTITTYRLSSLTGSVESKAYTVATGLKYPTICKTGAWVCTPNYYSSSWNGTAVESSSSVYNSTSNLRYIDNEYWFIDGNSNVRINSNLAAIFTATVSFTWGVRTGAEWEHGLYSVSFGSSILSSTTYRFGPTMTVRSKTKIRSCSGSYYYQTNNSSNARGPLVLMQDGTISGYLWSYLYTAYRIDGSQVNGYANVDLIDCFCGLEDMSEPRYKVRNIAVKINDASGGNTANLQFENFNVTPHLIYFWKTSSSAGLMGGVLYPGDTSNSRIFVNGGTIVNPTSVTATSAVLPSGIGPVSVSETYTGVAYYVYGVPTTDKIYIKAK